MGLYRSPDGDVVSIPDDQAGGALASGYAAVSAGDAGAPVESPATGGALGALGAGATSVLSGATLGLSDVALRGLLNKGDMERLAADRAAHPYLSGGGQVAGAILPSLVAPESILGSAPAGLVSRGAAHLAEGTGLAGSLVAAGTEGAIQNAGMYLSDVALGDRELSAEGVAGALGTGFAFGSGAGAAAHGIEAGTIAARRMFARYAEGGAKAAEDAASDWAAKSQESLTAFDQTADAARAKLAEARAAREQAALESRRAAAGLADARVAAPAVDAANAPKLALDSAIGKIEAQEAAGLAGAQPVKAGGLEDLAKLVQQLDEYDAARAAFRETHAAVDPEIEAMLRGVEPADLIRTTAPVPVGEFGAPGARGVKSAAELERAVSEASAEAPYEGAAARAPTEPGATRVLRGGTPTEGRTLGEVAAKQSPFDQPVAAAGRRGAEPSGIPEYDAIKAHEARTDDYLERDVSARAIAERGYYEPPGAGQDAVRIENARKAIAEGQNEAIKLNISPEGKITVTDGRHRLAAAIEADAPIKVKWSTGLEPAPTDVLRGGARAAESGGDLESLLSGTQAKVDEGQTIGRIGAESPARAEYVARKLEKQEADAAHFRAKANAENYAQSPMASEEADAFFRRLTMPKTRDAYVAQNIGRAMREEGGSHAAALAKVEREWAEISGGHPLATKQLEVSHDAALERAAAAADPAERAAAEAEAKAIEKQITAVGARPGAVEDVAALAPAITRVEKAAAELAETLGDAAPAAAREHAAAFRAAEDAARDKAVAHVSRVAEDNVTEAELAPGSAGLDRRPGLSGADRIKAAKQAKLEADAQFARARVAETEASLASKAAKQARDQAVAALPKLPGAGAAAEAPAGLGARIVGGAKTMGLVAGVAGELGIPGVPRPHDIPVIGPLLSAYLKYRALRAAAGRFTGRVPATAEARAAALAARTKDAVARGVDRALGLVERNTGTVRAALTAGSLRVNEALSRRAIDDGLPDAPKNATPGQLAAVRMREVAAAATNPQLVIAKVRAETRGITDPELITALENHLQSMFGHLNSTAPKGPPPNPYTKQAWTPSAAEALQWGRRLAVANDPSVAFQMLEARALTPDAADTLGAVYPKLFAQAQQRLVERAADLEHPVEYRQLAQMSMLFDVPLHAAAHPENAAVLAAAAHPPAAPALQADQPPAPPPPSVAGPLQISKLYGPESRLQDAR